jgi:hypothetical protein
MLRLQCAVIYSRQLFHLGALYISQPIYTRLAPHSRCLFQLRMSLLPGHTRAKHPEQH